MTRPTSMKDPGPHEVSPGTFLVGGDWAIAHGDADGLAHVASELGNQLDGDIAEELRELSRICLVDYDEAARRWIAVRRHVSEALAGTHPQPHRRFRLRRNASHGLARSSHRRS